MLAAASGAELRRRGQEFRMSRRKISTTIYITEEQNELLKRLHEATKVPVAEYIRQGIDVILKRHESVLRADRQLSFDALIGGAAELSSPKSE